MKNLTASGFTEAQAKALAHEQRRLFEANQAIRACNAILKMDTAQLRADGREIKIETVKAVL